jgi:Ca2+-binding EF-hand superfamily protein
MKLFFQLHVALRFVRVNWRRKDSHRQKKKESNKMKTNMKIMLTVLALGASALFVTAQDNNDGPPGGGGPGGPGGPGGLGRHHPPPLPIVMVLDTNHDGVIDADEIANASAALLTLDKNGDGKLTPDEYLPPLPKDAPKDAPRPPLPLIIKALDANGDGVIDVNEIANAPAALRSLDKRGDGRLTPDEYIGPRPQRPGGQGRNPGGNPGADDNNPPPGPPSGDAGGPPDGAPPGPPPGQR